MLGLRTLVGTGSYQRHISQSQEPTGGNFLVGGGNNPVTIYWDSPHTIVLNILRLVNRLDSAYQVFDILLNGL